MTKVDQKKVLWGVGVAAVLVVGALVVEGQPSAVGGLSAAAQNFNNTGYDYVARVYNGLGDGVDGKLDGSVWGDSTYTNDRVAMSWNSQWDVCNAAGNDSATACIGAKLSNTWDGNVPDGSKVSQRFNIIWVGSSGMNSRYWTSGGTLIWGSYEIVVRAGAPATQGAAHSFAVHATAQNFGTPH